MIEIVREYFAQYGRESDILEFDVSSATVDLAAKALNVEGKRIAKSIALNDGKGSAVLVVAAGDARIDNKKFRNHFGVKASMCKAEDTLTLTGHAVGGVCPFALKEPRIDVFLDISLKRFDTVFPACGSSNSCIELTLKELEDFSNFKEWVDVCSLPEKDF